MKQIEKFLQAIKYKPSKSFLDGTFVSKEIIVLNEEPIITLNLKFENTLNLEEVKKFEKALFNYKHKSVVNYQIENKPKDINLIFDYLSYILEVKNFWVLNVFERKSLIFEDGISITCESDEPYKFFNTHQKTILAELNRYGFDIEKITIKLNQRDIFAKGELSLEKRIQDHQKNQESKKTKHVPVEQYKNKKKTNVNARLISISEVDKTLVDSLERVKVKLMGQVVEKIEIKMIEKKNWMICNLFLTDHNNTIKVFLGKQINQEETDEKWKINNNRQREMVFKKLEELKKGDSIEVTGIFKISYFGSREDIQLEPEDIKEIPNPYQTNDHANKKRVEFNIHTKMSPLDGVALGSEYIKIAKQWNHEAIAITDDGSLQSFPEVYNSIRYDKSNKLKVIWGVDISMIDRPDIDIIKNLNKKINLETHDLIFFDLETTGLSSFYNEIIEFGAIRFKNNKLIEKKQIFIKPTKPISEEITELTGISNDHVKDAPNIEEVIKEIKAWIGDAVLIAHNADFDVSFLNQKFKDHNLSPVDNVTIDTLKLSWIMNKKIRNHRLGTIAKKLEVNYNPEIAHRADYDAEVLSEIFFVFKNRLEAEGNFSLEKISQFSEENITKTFAKKITVYAKNKAGLKSLYKLVSIAHTKYLGKTPIIPKWEIEKIRKNLIIGSSSSRGELWYKMANDRFEIEKTVQFYDFIQVQPLDTYTHLIQTNKLTQEEVIQTIRDLYELGLKNNKIVIASGDVFYLNPQDKKLREVLVYNKGIGGSYHYLFDFKDRIKTLPDNYFRTTKNMKEAFGGIFNKDIIEQIVVDNTIELAKQFDIIKPIPDKLYAPNVYENAGDKMAKIVYDNAQKIYGPKDKWHEILKARVEKELGSITKHGYAEIYLISAEIVNDSIDHGFLVGSRGSVGSSIVATFMNITEVNPLQAHYHCEKCHYIKFSNKHSCGYDLKNKKCPECDAQLLKEGHTIPFETFLGFEGDKIPDIDLNFAREFQSQAHDFTRKIFGEENVLRAGTISTLADRTAYGFVMNWAERKQIDANEIVHEISRIQKSILGSKRTTGQHPGGLIIVPSNKSIYDFTPINFPANDTTENKTTHFDFHSIHDNLLKLDLLGHLDPSVLKMLGDLTKINPTSIPTQDEKVMKIFYEKKDFDQHNIDYDDLTLTTIGIPEFGTPFVREMLSNTRPNTFADLVRISGLSHGTDVWTNNAKELIKNKIIILKDAITCRDDIMVYLMSKGMEPKQSFDIMEKVRRGQGVNPQEIKAMKSHHLESWYIESCQRIKYMFPKAHATAYVLMAWRVAWYKIYYPLEYYATYFTKRCDSFDVIVMSKGQVSIKKELMEFDKRKKKSSNLEPLTNKDNAVITSLESSLEMYHRGFNIKKIDIQKSQASTWIIDEDKKSLIPPFLAIDGLGDVKSKMIVEIREGLTNKEFTTKEQFLKLTKVNKTLVKVFEDYGLFEHIRDSEQLSIFDFE